MSKIRLYGDTSGYMDITVPAAADNSAMDLSTVGDVRSDQTNSFTARQNITGGASGRYGPYEDALRVKGNTYSYLEIEGTNSQAGLILNKDNSTGYGIGISNQGRLKLKPIASIDSTGLGNWKDQNTSGLEIDTNGFVFKPGQVSFHVNGLGNSGTGVQIYPSTVYNIGGHYNTSNGRFTAPVSGTYMFGVMSIANNTAGVYRFYPYVNGAVLGTNGDLHLRFDQPSGNYGLNATFTFPWYLNAGDYMEINCTQQAATLHGSTIEDYPRFWGYLLG